MSALTVLILQFSDHSFSRRKHLKSSNLHYDEYISAKDSNFFLFLGITPFAKQYYKRVLFRMTCENSTLKYMLKYVKFFKGQFLIVLKLCPNLWMCNKCYFFPRQTGSPYLLTSKIQIMITLWPYNFTGSIVFFILCA